MPRGISSTILTELNKTQVGAIVYLAKVTLKSAVKYWGERAVTFATNAYEARLINISGLMYSAGDSNRVDLTLANADGAITTLDRAESFLGAKVEIIEYLPDIDAGYTRWTGYADELSDIAIDRATLPAYSGSPTVRSDGPRRTIDLQCPWDFANTSNYADSTDFDGSECLYQLTSARGFTTSTIGALNTDNPATISVNALPDGRAFVKGDEIQIESEKMRITSVAGNSLTITRGIGGTVIASHVAGSTVKFANCQFSVAACKRRGMYGNNTSDTYVSGGTKNRNYFGGFPLLTGQIDGKFRASAKDKSRRLTLSFAGNESAYGSPLPLVYGHCRLVEPHLIIARAEGDFLLSLWVVAEGVLATNSTDAGQTTTQDAYSKTGGLENLYVNGLRRHDPRAGFGIQAFNGQLDQPPPDFSGITDFITDHLGLWGTAWVLLRINIKNNPTVDPSNTSVAGDFEIAYGRIVRVYTSATLYTRKATANPAMALLDFETSRRAGGGIDFSRFDIGSFVTVASYNDATVESTVDGSSVKRWTFNGALDNKRPFNEYENLICLSMYCLPPFEGIDGKLKIKSLKSETLTGLSIFSSKSGTSRNIVWEDGRSSLQKSRRPVTEIANEIKVNFVAYEGGKWIRTQLKISDRAAQFQVGKIVGDGSARIVSKSLDLIGVTSIDEASRIGTLVLRAGEFARGGLSNNLAITFKAFYKDAANVEMGDVIQVEDDLLSATSEVYFRVIDIKDSSQAVNGGGFVLVREIECTLHDNAIYDDTAFGATNITRLDGPNPNDTDAPSVTGFSIQEDGIFDNNGVPRSRLIITFTEPSPKENFKSVTLMRSTTSGGNPVNDWRFVAEIYKSPTTIYYDITNQPEVFTALSTNNVDGVPDPGTLKADSSFKYPRVTITPDGVSDVLAAPTGLASTSKGDRIWLTWNDYTGASKSNLLEYEVWRADSTVDGNTVFSANTAKVKLNPTVDPWYLDDTETIRDNPTRNYIYWVRGISLAGSASAASTGLTANAAVDTAIPSQVVWASMTAIRGEFVARWKNPSSNIKSIDSFVIQYTDDSDTTWASPITVPILLGQVYSKEGMDPNKKYRWRIAAHNLSGATNDASTAALTSPDYLDGKGWGPWTYWDGATGTTIQANAVGVSSYYDTALPGAVQGFTVTANKGEFIARWADPTSGNITIVNFAIEYSVNSDFSSPIATVKLGKIYEKTGYDPNKKYYWRIAAQNESGIANSGSGPNFGGETGWGDWTNFGSPTQVSSYIDTVVPGKLESLYICGKNGDFFSKWGDPLTGNLTLDKIAEQWSTDGSTWQSGDANNPVHVFAYGLSARGTDPDKTYYFRFAAHNDSGAASDANGPGGSGQALAGETGWGPWTYFSGTACTSSGSTLLSPGTAVSSGKLLVAVDTVLPGAPNSVSLSADEGIFTLTFEAPSTGNKTIDGYLVQYATDSGFTANKKTQLIQGFTFKLYDSNKSYFFRISAHNQSGITGGDADQTPYLDGKGWGAWQNSTPASASSGAGTGPLGTPNGSFTTNTIVGSFTKRVTLDAAPNIVTSALELYWEYTQGSITATHFKIVLADGTATFTIDVVSTPGSSNYRVKVKRWPRSKACTVTIIPINMSDIGHYPGTPLSPAAFSTGSNQSPSPDPVPSVSEVGQLDWAGGEVWFNTEQYRNNIPPTNGISTLSALSDVRDGANQAVVTINMPSYSQGAYIATHLVVLVRAGGGTISLTVDSIITLINTASLPSTYKIPFPFKASEEYSVALAALALTEDGYSFNDTFAQQTFGKTADIDINGTSTQNILLTPGSAKEIRAAETLRVDGKCAFTESDLSMSGDANDVNVGGTPWTRTSSIVASSKITGIANGVAGRFQVICNIGASNNVVLSNQNVNSAAANRIITGIGADITLAPNESATLVYDGSDSRWRVINRHP